MGEHSTNYIGCDLGDKYSHICVLNSQGDVVDRTRIKTTQAEFLAYFEKQETSAVVVEVGGHSRWVSQLLFSLRHKVYVANAREVRLIYANKKKNDKLDAEKLARLLRADPQLLHPIVHRSESAQANLSAIKARDGLVACRTQLVVMVRGMVKSHGNRMVSCDAASFHRKKTCLPEALKPALLPVMDQIESLTKQIKAYDQQIKQMCQQDPIAALLMEIPGVGPIIAMTFILSTDDPSRFRHSRDIGAYYGLTPRQRQSGNRDLELGITKAGNTMVRRLLVQAAHYLMGRFGPDTDLRRFGERILQRGGGKNTKKIAVIAVARKLAVVMHRMWITGEIYQPLGYGKSQFKQAA